MSFYSRIQNAMNSEPEKPRVLTISLGGELLKRLQVIATTQGDTNPIPLEEVVKHILCRAVDLSPYQMDAEEGIKVYKSRDAYQRARRRKIEIETMRAHGIEISDEEAAVYMQMSTAERRIWREKRGFKQGEEKN